MSSSQTSSIDSSSQDINLDDQSQNSPDTGVKRQSGRRKDMKSVIINLTQFNTEEYQLEMEQQQLQKEQEEQL